MLAYLAILVVGTLSLPSRFWDAIGDRPSIAIGLIGLWRFGWWGTHLVRAIIYKYLVFPKARSAAAFAWAAGHRPRRLHFMVITFREHPDTTRACIGSILDEVRATRLPATIWLGCGEAADETGVISAVEQYAADLDLDLVLVRQRRPGKRYAIGTVLRSIRRAGLADDELVFFMDGDSVIVPGLVERTTSLFLSDAALQASTTDEDVRVLGPRWMSDWLSMRFAQRRLAMQSHSLSKRVLTLTGRMSVLRARFALDPGFIDLVEEDHLNHWLWGRFRFLSGDDKSTWFFLLRAGAKMIYVPDARIVTIERIDGTGFARMVQNLRRWSGNMLRNGGRGIALGPRVGVFIWWCLIDQRIAMWTTLIGPMLALTGVMVTGTSWFLVGYLVWVLATRVLQATVLWFYAGAINLAYPVMLYFAQVVNAAVKLACMVQLSKQRWTNRGDQRAGASGGPLNWARQFMAAFIVSLSVLTLALVVVLLTDRVRGPSLFTALTLWHQISRDL